jgi:hypothetical protein
MGKMSSFSIDVDTSQSLIRFQRWKVPAEYKGFLGTGNGDVDSLFRTDEANTSAKII